MSKLVMGVLAATLALALAACGSSNKSSSSGSGSTTTEATSTTSGGGSANTDLASLAGKAKTASFKVTYKFAGGGEGLTVAQDGQGRQSVVQGDHVYIVDGSTVISCDGLTSTATCQQLGVGGQAVAAAVLAPITSAYTALSEMSSSLFNGHTSSENIAGRDATCVTVKVSDMAGVFGSIATKLGTDASASTCVDNETGVVLEVSGGSGESTTDVMVATDFSQPSDSDFQPPSTPQTVTLPNG